MSVNVFTLEQFLDPQNHPPTPLIELPTNLNPLAGDGVRIFAKRMDMSPLGNVKSLPALTMLQGANLDGIQTLVENSSGNTVLSLGILGRTFGIGHTQALVSNEVNTGKLAMLRLFGIEVIVKQEPICPDPRDRDSGIYVAKRLGLAEGVFNASQYDNQANPLAHYQITGPQIWEQLEGTVTVLAAGLGTTGTLTGTGSYLKEQNPSLSVVGVVRSPNNPVPGVRTERLLEEVAFDWRKLADSLETIGTQGSYLQSLMLCRSGLLVGPSSGFALAGLLQFLTRKRDSGQLDALRNRYSEVVAVFICCDSFLPYLHEYFEYLGEEHFPPIHNAELLQNKPLEKQAQATFAVSADAVYPLLYTDAPEVVWETVNAGNDVTIKEGVLLVDVRRPDEYEDAHMPGAILIEMNRLLAREPETLALLEGKQVYAVCRSGNRSGVVTAALREYGVDIWNISGGMIAWSRDNLPRVRSASCIRQVES